MQPHFFIKKAQNPSTYCVNGRLWFYLQSSNNPYLQSNNSMLFFNMQAFPKKYFYLFFTLLIHFKKSLLKVKKKTCFLLLFISKIEMLNF